MVEFGGEVEDGEGEGLMQVLVGQSCERERERWRSVGVRRK